jgi:biotin carboxyl carrier protein
MKMFRVVVNGSEYKVGIEELPEESPALPHKISTPSPVPTIPERPKKIPKKPGTAAQPTDTTGHILTSPMPGTIISIAVSDGASVSKGQTLLILEAMKMENEIKAPWDGVIAEVKVSQGASVNAGDILIVLSP